jgi:hypothetical protein
MRIIVVAVVVPLAGRAGRITLKGLLDAGLFKAGDELTIKLRGTDVTAALLADGKIRC